MHLETARIDRGGSISPSPWALPTWLTNVSRPGASQNLQINRLKAELLTELKDGSTGIAGVLLFALFSTLLIVTRYLASFWKDLQQQKMSICDLEILTLSGSFWISSCCGWGYFVLELSCWCSVHTFRVNVSFQGLHQNAKQGNGWWLLLG